MSAWRVLAALALLGSPGHGGCALKHKPLEPPAVTGTLVNRECGGMLPTELRLPAQEPNPELLDPKRIEELLGGLEGVSPESSQLGRYLRCLAEEGVTDGSRSREGRGGA